MSSYQVADHIVDHPPLFACRRHKSMLKLNRQFVDELLAWAADLTPQNLHDVAAASLDGDELAMRLSDYLVPPKVLIFNPRKIEGRGALPFTIVLVDRKFFGIPASYLRRRIFDGCEECLAENDPASDAAHPDYKPPVKAPPPPRPAPPAGPRPMTKSMPVGGPGGPPPKPGPRPAARPPEGAPQQKPAAVPTKSIPKRPAEPQYDAPPVKRDPHGG